MPRRRTVLAGLALVVALAGAVAWLAAGRIESGVNPDSFARIQNGMTRDEVIAIFGAPPDMGMGAGDMNGWMGPDAIAGVWIDKSGRVTHKVYSVQPPYYRVRSIWKKIKSIF